MSTCNNKKRCAGRWGKRYYKVLVLTLAVVVLCSSIKVDSFRVQPLADTSLMRLRTMPHESRGLICPVVVKFVLDTLGTRTSKRSWPKARTCSDGAG
jgi:hypothetical protein